MPPSRRRGSLPPHQPQPLASVAASSTLRQCDPPPPPCRRPCVSHATSFRRSRAATPLFAAVTSILLTAILFQLSPSGWSSSGTPGGSGVWWHVAAFSSVRSLHRPPSFVANGSSSHRHRRRMELGAWSTALPPRGFLLTRAKATSEDSVPSRSSSPPADDEAEWKAVVAAFKMYKAAYGDLKVPQRFVVPTLPPWPKPAQGLRLGKLVQDIRATGKFLDPRQSPRTLAARRQILEDLGFVWRVRQEPLAVPPQQPLPTQTPFQPEGSAVASSSSVSSPRPADIPPPQAVLSSSTTSSASSSSNALEGAALRPDGGSQVVPLEQLYRALQAYRQLVVLPQQQRLLPSEPPQLYWEVPSAFIVPNVPPWPETVRGLPLGLQVQYLRRRVARNRFVRDKFAALGIASVAAPDDGPRAGGTRASAAGGSRSSESANAGADDDQAAADKATANDVRFRNVYVALQAYKAAYGDLLVPQPFTVPKTPDWPPETWGLRLGARVNAIRSQGTFVNNNPERRVILDELGFVWSTPKERSRRGRRPATAEEENDRPAGSVGVHCHAPAGLFTRSQS